MARKLEIRIRDWLPKIILCYLEHEELDTISVLKSSGGILRTVGSAEEQFNEINSVLNYLVEKNLLITKPTILI